MSMSDPRELEWAKKPDALKEGWKTRVGTHMVHGVPLTVSACRANFFPFPEPEPEPLACPLSGPDLLGLASTSISFIKASWNKSLNPEAR